MLPTVTPLRITTARWATSMTCSILWEIMITDTPCSGKRRISCSTLLDSRTPNAAVGSSNIRTFVANATARAGDSLTLSSRH